MSTNQIKSLDPLTLPLKGQHLIEASAGTGKTYTLSGLVLRHLIGHGDAPARTIEHILVVTFTKAATQELRDRIRKRVQQAYQAFIGCQTDDPFIQAIVEQTSKEEHKQAMQRLDLALRSMDNAAIFTIHGFCQKMLSDLAFESGQLFQFNYEENQDALLMSAVENAWRKLVYPLREDPCIAEIIYQCCDTPEKLYTYVKETITSNPTEVYPYIAGDFERHQQIFYEHRDRLRTSWKKEQKTQLELLLSLPLNGTDHGSEEHKEKLHANWQKIQNWYMSKSSLPDFKSTKTLFYNKLRVNKHKKQDKKTVFEKPSAKELSILQQLEELHDTVKPIQQKFLVTAKETIKHEFLHLKQQQRILFQDDLLTTLHDALHQSDHQHILINTIREQFPVALIDEFQDTDAIQYGIFKQLYHEQHDLGWYTIGDPKQAIYAFRGADIFTYLTAKQDTTSHFSLDTNYRSSYAMMHAVNALFSQHDKAFQPNPNDTMPEKINYQDIKPNDNGKQQALQEKNLGAALQFRLLSDFDQRPTSAKAVSVAVEDTANHIAHLLNQADKDQISINKNPVQPKDIAVLVRSRSQAQKVQEALRTRNINSVFLMRDNIYNSEEALEIWRILLALSQPKNEQWIRNALATNILGLSAQDIDNFNHHENQRFIHLERFDHYHRQWQQQSLMAAFTRMMMDYQIAPRFLTQPRGQRVLTNIRHLIELLQEMNQKIQNESALTHWFHQQLDNADDKQQELRLESERNLVQIVTIHSSKGLEYNICFLPFVCSDTSKINSKAKTLLYRDTHQRLVWDLDKKHTSEKKIEELAESLRLFYVAMTRAKYRVYLTCYDHGKKAKSDLGNTPLGYLLQLDDTTDHTVLFERLKALEASAIISVKEVEVNASHVMRTNKQRDEAITPELNPTELRHIEAWKLTSYSNLVRNMSHTSHHEITPSETEASLNSFYFEKGANAGNFLHEVLERIDFRKTETIDEHLPECMRRYNIDDSWQASLQQWLNAILQRKIIGNFSLANLENQHKFVEMEFHLSMARLNHHELHRLLKNYGYPEQPTMSFEQIHGMLKGFIDLTFEHNQQFYIIDYKSNHLGYDFACYENDAMKQAITEHRYDLQYLIYTLALHRYLSLRLPNYEYEKHIGGCYYLFLRGIHPEKDTGVYFDKPAKELVEQLDELFTVGTAS